MGRWDESGAQEATLQRQLPAAARIFISTGEVSGDLQGGLLVEALHRQAAQSGYVLDILALGGERMAKAGARLLADTSSIGSIGIVETLPYLWSTLQIQRRVQQELRQHPPDLVIMIDYFGPNLSLGNFVRKHLPQVPTVYYIAPQEWVWSLSQRNTNRILQISDRLLAIFPNEARYYQERGGNVSWVGHPLIDRVQTAPSRAQARAELGIPPEQTAIALMPASRRQEIKYILPAMFQAAQQIQAQLPEVHFWIPLSLEIYRAAIERAIKAYGLRATLVTSSQAISSQTVIAAADLAITKSGTANLEIALLNVPQVVMYRVNAITAWIAEHVLKFSPEFVSPPNLVMMQAIVPELLQHQATPDRIAQEALALLLDPEHRQTMLDHYQEMCRRLGEPGVCDRTAQNILRYLQAGKFSR